MPKVTGYFENHVSHYATGVQDAQHQDTVYRPRPVRGGFGQDRLIGHGPRPSCEVIDLSAFGDGLTLTVLGRGCGEISDGIDAIVFRDVEKIILPDEMHDAIVPNLQAYRDQGLHVCLAEGEAAAPSGIAAE